MNNKLSWIGAIAVGVIVSLPAPVRLTPESGQVVVWSGGFRGRLGGLSGQVVFVL